MAAGLTNSCVIHQTVNKDQVSQNLYVWGENGDQRLFEAPKSALASGNEVIRNPQLIKLRYQSDFQRKQNEKQKLALKDCSTEYTPIEVACGPTNFWVIGRVHDNTFLSEAFEDNNEVKEILEKLRDVLLRERTLTNFFYLNEKDKKTSIRKTKLTEQEDHHQDDDFSEKKYPDPYQINIGYAQFENVIKDRREIAKNPMVVKHLIRVFQDHRQAIHPDAPFSETINLGDIEDNCLGYMQQNVKLFAFGQLFKGQRAFEESEDLGAEQDRQDAYMKSLGRKRRERLEKAGATKNLVDVKVISKPQAIKFPQFTMPIVQVAAGQGHVLALTIDYEMFSWGQGQGLGFGEDVHEVPYPKKLTILDHKGHKFQITQICCGKFHSMCLTKSYNIFSWGEGSYGRLGHGAENEDDQPEPKEIYALSQRKPILIAAGESHSGAISINNQIFTWGNGGFGRLGHGTDEKESAPRMVEDLSEEKIINLSLGVFHTLAVNDKGQVYAWGQNKYGKLGIHYNNLGDNEPKLSPVKIFMYKTPHHDCHEPRRIKKQHIIQVVAGQHHSMALQESGRLFTWGYPGKGLLGRQKKFAEIAQQVFIQDGIELSLAYGLEKFIIKYCDQKQSRNPNQKNIELPDANHLDGQDQANVVMISCGTVNTLALTNWGDVYVAGDNTYGQHAKEEIKIEAPTINSVNIQEEQTYSLENISVIEFPFTAKDQITYISCGGAHMFAKSSLDQVYGWGRNDEGQLGVGFLNEKLTQPTVVKGISYKGVIQISCGDDYTGACTMYGKVYVAGTLEGGKLGLGKGQRKGFQLEFRQVPNLPEIDYISCGSDHMLAISRYDPESTLKAINPFYKGPIKGTGKTYAWGKNMRGQLGIGNKDNQYAPCIIENAKERFKKVACGINFSVGLSPTNRVYFWGNYKYFADLKRTRDVEEPLIITQLETSDVMDISVSYKYCCALLDKGELRQWGKFLYAKHDVTDEVLKKRKQEKLNKKKAIKKGEKVEIKIETISKIGGQSFHVPMSQIVAGPNHACGIAIKRIPFVWGHNNISNRMGLKDSKAEGNAKIDPQPMEGLLAKIEQRKNDLIIAKAHLNTSSFDNSRISTPSEASSHDSSYIFQQAEEVKEGADGQQIKNKTLSQDKSRHTGMEPQDDAEEEDGQAVGVSGSRARSVAKSINKTGASLKGGGGGNNPLQQSQMDAPKDGPGAMNFTQVILHEIELFNSRKKGPAKHSSKSHLPPINLLERFVDLHVLEFVRQSMHKKTHPQMIRIWKKNLQGLNLINANFQMQKMLKQEEANNWDERSVGIIDNRVRGIVRELLQSVYRFSKDQEENYNWINKAKSSFFTRVIDQPFLLEDLEALQQTFKGFQPELLKYKQLIQEVLLHLHLHPCYIIKILKSNLITFDDQKLLIKQLYKSNKKSGTIRCNYLLISVFRELITHEIEDQKLEDINLIKKDNNSIAVYIFRRILKSNMTNQDTLSCLFCHIVNLLMSTFSQNQGGGGADSSLDVEDETGKKDAGSKAGKGGKGGEKVIITSPAERAANLVQFMQKLIDSILNDQVLKDTALNLQYTKKVSSQLDFIKKQVKRYQDSEQERIFKASAMTLADKNAEQPMFGGLDDDDIRKQYPSFRFSGEVMTCIRILFDSLSKIEHDCDMNHKEVLIAQQILSLVFTPQLDKIFNNYELYVFQYLNKVKMLTLIDEQIKMVHAINIKNVLHALDVFFSGKSAFPGKDGQPRTDAWAIDLNIKLGYYFSTVKLQFFHKLMKMGKEIDQLVSYKNFENMVIHSLEQDNFRVCISKKLVVGIMKIIKNNENSISLQFPASNDPVIKLLSNIDLDSLSSIEALPDNNDQFILKLKTRLFNCKGEAGGNEEEVLAQYVRCYDCQAILTEDIAVQNFDQNLVITQYEADDKQSLVQRYVQFMKLSPPMNKDQIIVKRKPYYRKVRENNENERNKDPKQAFDGLDYFVKVSAHIAKNEKDYELSQAIQKFEKNIDIEVVIKENKMAKAKDRAGEAESSDGNQDQDKANPQDDDQDEENKVYNMVNQDLIKMTEKKINLRIKQVYELQLIEFQIQRYLLPHIAQMMDSFRTDIINQNIKIGQNYDYGLANRDFSHMAELVQYANALAQMAKVNNFIKDLKTSQTLANALKFQQKETMKGYLQVDVPALKNNKTILNVKLKELDDLMQHCHVVLIAQDAQAQVVEFKLIFKEIKKQICGPPITVQEQVLMKFNIRPKRLLVAKQQTARNIALGIISEEELNTVQPLIFEENEAIEFDPDKLMALITQMNRQKAAYVLTAQPEKKDRKQAYKQE